MFSTRYEVNSVPNMDEQVIPALRGGFRNSAPQEGDFVPAVKHIGRLHHGLPGLVGLKPLVVFLQLLVVGSADVLHVIPSLLVQLRQIIIDAGLSTDLLCLGLFWWFVV